MMAKFSWLPQPIQLITKLACTGKYEATHQGIGNEIIESNNELLKHSQTGNGDIAKKERIGGLLNYYYRQSA